MKVFLSIKNITLTPASIAGSYGVLQLKTPKVFNSYQALKMKANSVIGDK